MPIDRGFIKWQPFDSVTSTKKILSDLVKEKNKAKMPYLSDEQINSNEEILLNAFHNDETLKIIYFKSDQIKTFKSKIKKIDSINKKIILINSKIIYFSQIINITKN